VAILFVVQDIIEMEQLQYGAYRGYY